MIDEVKKFCDAIDAVGPSPALISGLLGIKQDYFRSVVGFYPAIARYYEGKVEDIIDTVRRFGANPSIIAKIYEVDRFKVGFWFYENPALQQLAKDYKESFVDVAEYGLMNALQEQHPWAIMYTLSRLGADRGWGDQVHVNLTAESKRLGVNFDQLTADLARKLVDGATIEGQVNQGSGS